MTEKVKQLAAPLTSSDEIDIGRLVVTVVGARWWVLGATVVFALYTAVYTLFTIPVYSADVLVQIRQDIENLLVQDIDSASSNRPSAPEAGIQLIQSHLVLGKTVDDLNLDITVTKDTFPIFGVDWDWLMGCRNETVNMATFTLPKAMDEQTLMLNMLNDTSYQLVNDGDLSAQGQVDRALEHDGVTMLVEAIYASPENQFAANKFSALDMVNTLQNNLMVTKTGRNTGVLSLTSTGEDRGQIHQILNNITRNYLQQSVERKLKEAAKSLAFLAK